MAFTAQIAFVPLRSSLANLPQNIVNLLIDSDTPAQNVVVELSAQRGLKTAQVVAVGWTGLASGNRDTVELDPTFAQGCHLAHGAKVTIKISPAPPVAHRVWLEPATPGDWDIVETHAGFLETYMINQVRAVSPRHPITVFPSPSAIASLHVTQTEPRLPPGVVFARLSPDSEVIVAPKLAKPQTQSPPVSGSTPNAPPSLPAILVRAAAYPHMEAPDSHRLELLGDIPSIKDGQLVKISIVTPNALVSEPKDEVEGAKAVYATVSSTQSTTGIARLSYGLSCALQVCGQIGVRLQVRPASVKESSGMVTIRPLTVQTGTLKMRNDIDFASIVGLDHVGNGYIIPPVSPHLPHGALLQTGFEYGTPTRYELGSELPVAESRLPRIVADKQATNGLSISPNSHPVVGRGPLVGRIHQALNSGAGVLVYGTRGCGKSAVLNEITRVLEANAVRCIRFASGSYGDKALPTIRDTIHKAVMEAAWHAPAILVFDDLDRLVPAELEHAADSSRSRQLAELFCNEVQSVAAQRKVTVLATAQDRSSLHSLVSSGHVFDEIINVKSPDRQLREQILMTALDKLGIRTHATKFDASELTAITEGYQPGDLWTLTERVAALLALRATDSEADSGADSGDDSLTNSDGYEESPVANTAIFEAAARDYTPASLRGVKLEKSPTKWADVGGMAEVKRVLLETLEWPTKYAPIFANCPLRLRSGLLLYGYPGCGKTFVASAVAGETGLNFISVKGPEILNKYIGASEQSVRDLFDRAQAAKPCVLFFDEFDSIAPKRGHDSTGVTDRVVNQLLTQMDGAEGLDGVYVLAATSRPDLIDSALLRPGRLDKSLLCDMPSHSDRLHILQQAQSRMSLSKDVDLASLAAETPGYTPADLQALMYNAYLDAIHGVLDSTLQIPSTTAGDTGDIPAFQAGSVTTDLDSAKRYFGGNSGTSGSTVATTAKRASSPEQSDTTAQVVVTMRHVRKALANAKPSISRKELLKLQRIYAQFVADRDGQMPPGDNTNEIGGRVTLG